MPNNGTFDLYSLPAVLIYSACNAVHFHISIEKAPANPQGYDSESPSLSTLRWSCFCSPVQPRYQSRAKERKSTRLCVECTSWGLQRAMMARQQTVLGCSTFVITEGHSRGGPRLHHWQQYKHILMGRFYSVAAAVAGRSCVEPLCCANTLCKVGGGKKNVPCVCVRAIVGGCII